MAGEADYADTFRLLGRPLGTEDAVSSAEINEAEAALDCRVPGALAAFYQVAGRALDFTDHHDHFFSPSEWLLHDSKLVFLAENQGVVLYAVDTEVHADDPPVLMANNDDTLEWGEVCSRCSEFLQVMIHWEGAFGGAMPLIGSATVDERFGDVLEKTFRPRGRVEGLWAYSNPGLAVCLVEWTDGWKIFVGAANEEALAPIAKLGVELEMTSSGVLLSVTNRPIWADSSWLGLLFLLSGISTSVAAMLLVARWQNVRIASTEERLKRFDRIALILELVVLIVFVISLGGVARAFLNAWGVLLLLGVIGVGILMPLRMGSASAGPLPSSAPPRDAVAVASILVLFGGLVLRMVVLLGSEQVHVAGGQIFR